MKSEWRVTSNNINGKMMYAAYRLIDMNGVDHSGNREYAGKYIEDKQLVQAAANALNSHKEVE